MLYYHGNNITNLQDVLKLQQLPKLNKLTLHGNPIAEAKNYKWVTDAPLSWTWLDHAPSVPVSDLTEPNLASLRLLFGNYAFTRQCSPWPVVHDMAERLIRSLHPRPVQAMPMQAGRTSS